MSHTTSSPPSLSPMSSTGSASLLSTASCALNAPCSKDPKASGSECRTCPGPSGQCASHCEQSPDALSAMNSWERLCGSMLCLLVNTDAKTGQDWDTVYTCHRGMV
eukprot:2747995-Rhodomonas_salina.1